jgi:hypothetical protein
LQLDGCNYNRSDHEPVASGPDLDAIWHEPIATRIHLVATGKEPVATGKEPVATRLNWVATS